MPGFRFAIAAVMTVFMALTISACSDSEVTQRKAFIDFLQTRIVDKKGVSVPQLTAEETKSLGSYAAQYKVITDFHAAMNEKISKPMEALTAKGAITSINDAMNRKEDIKAAFAGLSTLRTAMDEEQATADKAHAALKQPEDLKPVFDKAYDKTVSNLANTYKEIFPATSETFDILLKVVDFVDQHKDKITISGSMFEVSDPTVQAQLNTLLEQVNAKGQAMSQAQKKMRAAIYGN
ncbi:DUF3053 family protein [Phyllobacterium sp. TAF24]|uniref:DUF3053 family protein n=1 Tax=Phyllobacterium sp. TAF24 TaxID=3233068 RepID=UPI003F998FEC